MDRKPPWEHVSGVQLLRLYKTDLHPDWPRVVLLDLDEGQFNVFCQNPLGFAKEYHLYPEQPILWMTACAKPPMGKGVPRAAKGSRWTVVVNHCKASIATCAACPQTVDETIRD